jgi:hypothetical protein
MKRSAANLDQIFETHLSTLALTLRPNSVTDYRCVATRFLSWLHAAFPRVCRLSQFRRAPHLLAWFRHLCEQQPPLSNQTRRCYLLCLRRMLDDLAANGHAIAPDLIRPDDFPPTPRYLPRPLSPQDDQLLQRELRRTNDLNANALLLMRATGIRIRECIGLPLDCLRQLGATHGLFMSRSASFTTNDWFPSMPTLAAPLAACSNCVLWLQPRNWRDPGASYSRVLVTAIPCITGFEWRSRMPVRELTALVRYRRTSCATPSPRK